MLSDTDKGANLLLKVRGNFIASGSSLNAWCKSNGVALPNARMALLGRWNGPKAYDLVARIIAASEAEE